MTTQETQVTGQPIAVDPVPEQRHGDIALSLKTVGDLRGHSFFIPSYQRGYRWEKDQVLALMNDLHDFEKRSNDDPKKFYCLQPLVVMKQEKDGWGVVDGQQRLTTIFLILNRMSPAEPPLFQIRYERHPETEQGLAGLLESVSSNHHATSPDLYFIQQADKTIQDWMQTHPGTKLTSLTKCDGNSPCAKFIWDEIRSNSEAIQAFIRLNSGKIRLKDSELIRASLLQSRVLPEGERQRIAIEWDRMEHRLQYPEFWSFLNGKGQAPDSRIELLFSLVAKNEAQKNSSDRKIFDEFFEQLKTTDKSAAITGREKLWAEVDGLFDTLEEWFEDHGLFHLIGILIDLRGQDQQKQRDLILELRDASNPSQPPPQKPKTKTEFVKCLKQKIRNEVFPDLEPTESVKTSLEKLNYGKDDLQIRRVLLCLNLATLLADETKTARFSFAAYQRDNWDIEHIRATNTGELETVPDGELRDTIQMLRNYLLHLDSKKEYSKELDLAHEDKMKSSDRTRLNKCYETLYDILQKIAKKDAENEDSMEASNNIKNLTLLDCGTNRGYGNSWFMVKRRWVLDIEHKKYLLPCTRNVFTKSYSKAPGSLLHWTSTDADDYLEAIAKVLTEFFKDTWEAK